MKIKTYNSIIDVIHRKFLPHWDKPLDMNYRGTTIDSFSFLDYEWRDQLEINLFPHVGSFGIRRRHDIHKGVDLYAEVGTKISAVEDGEILKICWFTGEARGLPWWENTKGVYVLGKSGIVVYGELEPNPELKVGDKILSKSYIGTVKRVLKKDNHRPLSMLHLELHHPDYIHTGRWEIGNPKPDGLFDPTNYLINAYKK